MTVIPAGAKLAPVDLPPPPPSSDPREPEPSKVRNSRTPQRARSPRSSRASSPTRGDSSSPPPILAPKPRTPSGPGSLGVGLSPSGRTVSHGSTTSAMHAHPHSHIPHSHPHLSRPSSPCSIHSSGSAIFERDIEMPAVASLSLNQSGGLNHKSSRIFHQPHGSTLEHTVPAVLDDAVEALTAPDNALGGLEIEAPTGSERLPRSSSVNMSPALRARVGSLNSARSPSRSPSPDSSAVASPISLGMSAQQFSPTAHQFGPTSPGAPALSPASVAPSGIETLATPSSPPDKHRPAPLRQISSGPQLPGGWAFTDEDATGATAVHHEPVAIDTPVPSALPAHLTPTKDKRRISFISYNDLLLSVPTTVTSLGEITSGNLSPDHLPGAVSPSVPARSPVIAGASQGIATGGPMAAARTVSQDGSLPALGSSPRAGDGEWQREGLGKGLEQRLEDLVTLDHKV